jgi:hypothetical protein
VEEIEKYLKTAPNDAFHIIPKAVAAMSIPGLLRGAELTELRFEDVLLHVAVDKRMYSIKIHRKK